MVEENIKKKGTSRLGEVLFKKKNEYGALNALLNPFQIEDPKEYKTILLHVQ